MVDKEGHHDLDDLHYDLRAMTEVMHKVLDDRGIPAKVHHEHHDFVEYLITKQRRKEAFIKKFQMSLIGTAATALVGALIWVGKIVVDHILTHGMVGK